MEALGHGPGGVVVRVDGLVIGVEDLLHPGPGAAVLIQRHHLPHRHLRLDHADEGGHHSRDRLGERVLLYHQLVIKQGRPDGDQGKADEPDQLVQRLHHLRPAHPLIGLGLQGQPGGIAGRAYAVQPGPALAGHHKAAAEQLVPGVFGDGVRLAGDKGLVHRHLAGHHRAVGGNLVPRAQLHNVLPHQLVEGDCAQLAVPHHLHPGLAEQGELFQGGPGAQLLDDADDGVDYGDAQEHHVPEIAGHHQQRRQHHKHQVKKGQGVFPDDLAGGLGIGGHSLIAQPPLQKLARLGGGQPHLGVGKNALRLPAVPGGALLPPPGTLPIVIVPPALGRRGLLRLC